MKKVPTPIPVVIAVFTVVTIIFWTSFEVYRSFTQEPDSEIPQEILLPLSPTLDIQSLNNLQQRIELSESQIGSPIISTPTPTPELTEEPIPTPFPESTESAEPTPEETGGGTPSG